MVKMFRKLTVAIRWQIALFLDRFPDVCWANVASWAIYPEYHAFSEIFGLRGTAGRCGAGGDIPYCGKCVP